MATLITDRPNTAEEFSAPEIVVDEAVAIIEQEQQKMAPARNESQVSSIRALARRVKGLAFEIGLIGPNEIAYHDSNSLSTL